jgi:hypothetical protein
VCDGYALARLQDQEIVIPLGCQQFPDELGIAPELLETPAVLFRIAGRLLPELSGLP